MTAVQKYRRSDGRTTFAFQVPEKIHLDRKQIYRALRQLTKHGAPMGCIGTPPVDVRFGSMKVPAEHFITTTREEDGSNTLSHNPPEDFEASYTLASEYDPAKIFAEELEQISDEKFRNEVSDFLVDHAPEYFYRVGASRTTYHMACTRVQPLGLVRHTKLVVRAAKEVLDMADSPEHRDVFIAAALLHDMYKDGDPERPGTNHETHGLLVAERIEKDGLLESTQMGEKWPLVHLLVTTHMGRWTQPVEHSPDNLPSGFERRLAQLFHTADYFASRDWESWIEDVCTDSGS